MASTIFSPHFTSASNYSSVVLYSYTHSTHHTPAITHILVLPAAHLKSQSVGSRHLLRPESLANHTAQQRQWTRHRIITGAAGGVRSTLFNTTEMNAILIKSSNDVGRVFLAANVGRSCLFAYGCHQFRRHRPYLLTQASSGQRTRWDGLSCCPRKQSSTKKQTKKGRVATTLVFPFFWSTM